MEHHLIETHGTDLSTWQLVATRTDRRVDDVLIEGLVFKKYRQDSALGTLSLGQFILSGVEIVRAWGVEAEPHCSFHLVRSHSGTLSAPIAGCPDVTVDTHHHTLTVRAGNEVISYPITINTV